MNYPKAQIMQRQKLCQSVNYELIKSHIVNYTKAWVIQKHKIYNIVNYVGNYL